MYKIKIYKYYYEYSATHLDILTEAYKCSKTFNGAKTNYLYETNLLSFSCISSDATVLSILTNNNLGIEQINEQFKTCESIYGHSVIYSTYFTKYYIVSDVICDNHQRTYIPLIGEIPKLEEEIEEEEEKEEKNSLIEEEEIIVVIEEEEKTEFRGEEIIEEEEKIIFIEKENEIFKEIYKEKEIFEEREKEEEKYEITEKKIEQEYIEEEKPEYTQEELIITDIKTDLSIGCIELVKCSQCNQESISKNLCIKCNNEKEYYLLKVNYGFNKYIECVNDTTKPYNFYFDEENKDYEPCYETCFKCNNKGDGLNNHCTLCDGINYIKQPEFEDSNNCVPKCKYLYYYTDYGQYKCSDYPYCPDDYNYLIKNKNKCTNNCAKDDTYKYYYNRECYKQCPEDTKDDNDYICKDIVVNRCILSESNFFLFNENITDDMIEKMVIMYVAEFGYTDTHVSIYKNDIYTVTIYKDLDCISDLALNTPEIIFGECEVNVKQYYNINENLIVAIVDKNIDGKDERKMISYGLYSPSTGNKLNSDEICNDDKLVILESLSFKLEKANIDISTLSQLYSQGINVFDLSNTFIP